MTFDYQLKLAARTDASRDDLMTTFYWPHEGDSSFLAPFGPRLGALGPVHPLNVDLVRLALLVFAADRSTPRKVGFTNWSSRDFSITVPVGDESVWIPIRDDLASLLSFLTGDDWSISFRNARPRKESVRSTELLPKPSRVVLMSGGADSALGVLESRRLLGASESHVVVSHIGFTGLAPIQRAVADTAKELVPGPEQFVEPIRVGRRTAQVDGTAFKNEFSTRSRSLLFLSLGLAHASIHGVPLWIPENGFASLNPPLSSNRRGSLSTRTTHPAFLGGLSELLSRIGAQAEIENPFAAMTKGEMFRAAADDFGDDRISDFLSATHSCGLAGQRWLGAASDGQCGVCFGCVVRRSSFKAASLTDKTDYLDSAPSGEQSKWLDENSIVPDLRQFVRRGVRRRDVLALELPDSYPVGAAMDLCHRGVSELREYVA